MCPRKSKASFVNGDLIITSILSLFLILLSCDTVMPQTAADAKLLFKSGFEGVSINYVTSYGQWWGKMSGTDTVTGYTWPDDLPGDGAFQPNLRVDPRGQTCADARTNNNNRVPDVATLNQYIEEKIVSVNGPFGPTQALYVNVKKGGANQGCSSVRSNFVIFVHPDEPLNKQGYIKYWLKLQDNLETVMKEGSRWRLVIEWKASDEYRFSLNIGYQDKLYWYAEGKFNYKLDWKAFNTNTPVPVGEWFLFEVFYKLDPTDGRLLVIVDGQTIIDYTGRTKSKAPVNRWFIFKDYTGHETFWNGLLVTRSSIEPHYD